MNFRGLFKWAGVCAIGYAVITLASYLAAIASTGFMSSTTATLSPERILQILQARGTQISIHLDQLSYFLWIPALMGIFAFLRERTPGRAHVGGAFAVFGLAGMAVSTIIGASMMKMAQGPITEALKERLTTLDAISLSFALMALNSLALANLLWGLALQAQAGFSKIVGYFFLAQTAVFVLTIALFVAQQDFLFNIGIVLATLAIIAAYATAGTLLWQIAQEQPTVTPTQQEKGRAAGAAA
jgi:hypothetical protein